jgi:perosamine synthetase
MIPLSLPDLGEDEIEAVKEVIKSGWLTYGPKAQKFEKMFADYIGVKNAVAMNSCTSALFLSIRALEIKGEVILPSFTWVASANSIVTAGATPVFADINYDTCNIAPESIEEKITPLTEAVMVVHYGGQSCEMDKITSIVNKHGLYLIEDSAETIGGEFLGKKTGSFGLGCFSFFPTKNITTGEGGMLTTNNDNLALKVRTLVGHGINSGSYQREGIRQPWYRVADIPGYNFRLSDILAAIGIEQMNKLEKMNDARREAASFLYQALSDIEELDLPVELEKCKHVYQMYNVKVKPPINRDEFVLNLRSLGVGASVHFYPPVHKHPPYQHIDYHLPVTDIVSNRIVTLPMYSKLNENDLRTIVDVVKKSIFSGKIRNYQV